MSLKQDVVIVNEYTIKNNGGGSRGGTPGDYVTRYMARGQATESLAPIRRHRTDDFILRYMAREDAVEHAPDRTTMKSQMRQAQGNGGVAFGFGSVSLSDDQLRAASAEIQRQFEAGHTVLKTVLSFDEGYLKAHGLVDADFHCEEAGDYRGHLDQMKLRMAIMHGLERMSRGHTGFDDLRYVGVIQVDTEHVHCHLAMVDAGPGHLAPDGTQRGKLSDRHKSRLRRGLDAWLDEKQSVRQLSSAVGYERRNVITYVKRWAHERMQSESLSQFLLACLPADRSLWRAGSHAPAMRKPNQIVRELVIEQLAAPGSPMPAAMEKVHAYADQRRSIEGLGTAGWQRLVDQGREQILERAANGVYGLLRALPADELTIRTPMLEVMGMDYQDLAARVGTGERETGADDLASFGFRLRSYSSRLEHHRSKREAYRNLSRDWENADRAGVATADSRPLYDFYRFEEDYNARLMAKYRHFLPFSADPSGWYEQQDSLAGYGSQLLSLIALRNDASLQRMRDDDEAEALGREIYGQPGGRLLTRGAAGRAVLDERIESMREVYRTRLADLRSDLAEAGLVLSVGETGQSPEPVDAADPAAVSRMTIVAGDAHPFDQVRGLDLHHLEYDFFTEVELGPRVVSQFLDAAHERRRLVIAAMVYLDRSGQSEAIAGLPVDDIAAMHRLADTLAASTPANGPARLPSRLAQLRAEQAATTTALTVRRSRASSLDSGLSVRVRHEVDQAVRSAGPEADGRSLG